MTREEHLKFCKICNNQKFDSQKGIICGLRNSIADFKDTCESFDENTQLKEKLLAKNSQNELSSQIASQGTRFANYLLDRIFILIISFFLGFILTLLLTIISPNSAGYFEQMGKLEEFVWGFIIGMFYYSFFEALTGRSIAKFITGTKVVDENGNKPTFDAILLRSLCRYIPFNAFSFLGSDAVGWHDSFSKTRVIKIKQ
ncbi:RDD family protein [Tenacibaculum singaporense]|uniref:RDD family protein n=1 Tax=Tenacibaculum singaporense TaxID=2358479 RepID=A0A3S8R2C4_9FLAO|nr:RDD family protein [Tenacibaculum singaporense]AZJ34066.1 RDD family protein [Tenacibaculum singaporense]